MCPHVPSSPGSRHAHPEPQLQWRKLLLLLLLPSLEEGASPAPSWGAAPRAGCIWGANTRQSHPQLAGAGTLPIRVTISRRGHPDGRTAPGQPVRASSVTQHSRERAVSRGICHRRGWTRAQGTAVHLRSDRGSPAAALAPSRGDTAAAQHIPRVPQHIPGAGERIRQVPGPPTGSSRGNFLPAGTSRSRALRL